MSQTAIITGANRGIGLEFCRQYLADGWKVYAVCRMPEKAGDLLAMKQEAGAMLEIMPLDVTNAVHRENLRRTLGSERIDLLINNAGVYGERQPLGHVSSEEWLRVLEVNTVAPLLVVQTLSDLMPSGAKVALISSKMASIADNSSGGSYIYRSSKSALNAVGKSLSHDLMEKGVSVAICHPGWVQTRMGGENALIDVGTSVTGLKNVIDRLSLETSGRFFNYDGAELPW